MHLWNELPGQGWVFVPFPVLLTWGRAGAVCGGAALPCLLGAGPLLCLYIEKEVHPLLGRFWKRGFSTPATLQLVCFSTVGFLRRTVVFLERGGSWHLLSEKLLSASPLDAMFCVFCFAFVLFPPVDRSNILTGSFPVMIPKMASLKHSRTDP